MAESSAPEDVELFYNHTLQEELFVEAASSGDLHKLNALIARLQRSSNDYFSHKELIVQSEAMCYRALQSAAENGHAQLVNALLCFVDTEKVNLIVRPIRLFSDDDDELLLSQRKFLCSWHLDANTDPSRVYSSPLHLAVREGHLEVVQKFITFFQTDTKFREMFLEGLDVIYGLRHSWFKGLVEWAVRWGQADILKDFITRQPFIPLPSTFIPLSSKIAIPLHLAVYHNHLHILRLLLEENIDLNPNFELAPVQHHIDDLLIDGLALLHLAAFSASPEMVNLLVNAIPYYCKPKVCRSQPELFTPLHIAAHFGNLQVVQFFLQRPTQTSTPAWNIADMLLAKDSMGRIALHYAARQGNEAIVQELLNSSLHLPQATIAITSIADRDGLLPLHMAARSGHARVIEKLLATPYAGMHTINQGMHTINQQAKHSTHVKDWVEREFTHIHWKTIIYHGEMYRFPRPKMFDSLFFQTKGFTPSHFAARYGHEAALQQILKADQSPINLHAIDERGFLAWDWMEVQNKGHVFLNCIEQCSEVNKGCLESIEQAAGFTKQNVRRKRMSEVMLKHIASDIVNEKKAMEDIWHASCSYSRPRLTAAIVRWLEDGDSPGRFVMLWLPRAALKGDIELLESLLKLGAEGLQNNVYKAVKETLPCVALIKGDLELLESLLKLGAEEIQKNVYKVVEERLMSVSRSSRWNVFESNRIASTVRELLLKLPAGNIRATAARRALRNTLEKKDYEVGKEIILALGKEAAPLSDELQEIAKMLETHLLKRGTEIFRQKDLKNLLVAVVGVAEIFPSSFLRKLLTMALQSAELQENGLAEMLLDRPELKKGLYEDRQVFLVAANAMLVGAALIAGLAFQSWLQPPLGYNYPYHGQNYAEVHVKVHLFWRFNNVAFYISVASFIFGAYGAVPAAVEVDIVKSVENAKSTVALASTLLVMALVCIVVAFTLAQVDFLPPFPSDLEFPHSSLAMGLGVCGLALQWFFYSILPLLFSIVRSSPTTFTNFVGSLFNKLKSRISRWRERASTEEDDREQMDGRREKRERERERERERVDETLSP